MWRINVVVMCFVSLSTQLPTSDYYVAGVVEFTKDLSNNGIDWNDYVGIIEEACDSELDIIVFPETEAELTREWKVPYNGLLKTYPIPALQPEFYDEPLVKMSEAARKHSMYVVINLHEIVDCFNENDQEYCPEEKVYIYNTEVVFDRTGAVILRYRKNHLFLEPELTPSFNHSVASFTTDFGVTFGVLICFDILNQVPAMQLVDRGIDNVILSSNWVSDLPFLTAVAAYQNIAYGLDINLLVSGFNEVSNYASGSGIWSGKGGTLVSLISGVPMTQLLIAKVPKTPGKPIENPGPIRQNPAYFDGLATVADNSLKAHITKLLKPGYQEINLAFNDIECSFRINMRRRKGEKSYRYRAGAFSGTTTVLTHPRSFGIRDCAIFICSDEYVDSCGKRFIPYEENSTAIFEQLTIEATVPKTLRNAENGAIESAFYPSTLDISFLPLEPKDFNYNVKQKGNKTVHTLILTNNDAELYTFGFFGRNFVNDGEKITEPFEDIIHPNVDEDVNYVDDFEDFEEIDVEVENIEEDLRASPFFNLS